jgi:hypothetical protein
MAWRSVRRIREVQDGSVMGLDGASLEVSARQFPRLTIGKLRLGAGGGWKWTFAACAKPRSNFAKALVEKAVCDGSDVHVAKGGKRSLRLSVPNDRTSPKRPLAGTARAHLTMAGAFIEKG